MKGSGVRVPSSALGFRSLRVEWPHRWPTPGRNDESLAFHRVPTPTAPHDPGGRRREEHVRSSRGWVAGEELVPPCRGPFGLPTPQSFP